MIAEGLVKISAKIYTKTFGSNLVFVNNHFGQDFGFQVMTVLAQLS